MLPAWDDLALCQIDLHLHGGTERPEPYSLADLVDFAVATGRRIIGITDHFGRFLGLSKRPLLHYPGTLDGFGQFATDVRAAREAHPDALLLFGPETGPAALAIPEFDRAMAMTDADYFLGEPGSAPDGMRYGDYLVALVATIAAARDRTGKPGILVHPLRVAVNDICGKTGPGPAHPKHPPLPPLATYGDPLAHVENLLDFDLGALAEACRRHDVPVEINESSWGRILGMNAQGFIERYLFFYRALLDAGVSVVLGSDMHNPEHGAPVPFVAATMLGVRPRDMTFLRHWLG